MSERRTLRIGAISTILGAGGLLGGTMLHPMEADPGDAAAALEECASSEVWIASHLVQLAGLLFVAAGLVALYGSIARRSSRSVARLGMAGAVASAGVFTILQAVDGIALKRMADTWAGATAADKPAIFHAALAVRQIETGLASLSVLLFGVTVVLFGVSIAMSHVFPKWLGWLAVLAGLGTATSGLVVAYTGFSELAMGIGMPSHLLLLVWLLVIGSLMWRRSDAI